MSAFRVGVIGLGSIGYRMLAAIADHPDFVAVAAFDPSTAAVARARDAHPEMRIAECETAIATADDVDIVYVACPPAQHARHALAAKAAGKPVLCEKPLGIDVEASRALVADMAGGPAHGVNFLLAASRGADHIVERLDAGALGDLVAIDLRFHLPAWAERRYGEAPWLARRAEGGFLREVVSHHIYFASRLLGPLTIRHAAVERPACDADAAEYFASALLHGGDVPVSLSGGTRGAGADINACVVRGTRASYRIRNLHWLDVADDTGWKPAYTPPAHPERETHLRQLDRVKRMLEGEAGVTASFADALHVQGLVEALRAD